MNRQSPIMLVAESPELIAELSRLNAEVMGMTGDPFYGAPIVVSVLADTRVRTWPEDGSLVIGNLLNAAHAVGLAGCWIHRAREVFDSPRGRELLAIWGVAPEYRGVGHCILGYPKDEPKEAPPRKENYIRFL
jgi:nitroreductase